MEQHWLAGFKSNVALDPQMPIHDHPVDRTGTTRTDRTDGTYALEAAHVRRTDRTCTPYSCVGPVRSARVAVKCAYVCPVRSVRVAEMCLRTVCTLSTVGGKIAAYGMYGLYG